VVKYFLPFDSTGLELPHFFAQRLFVQFRRRAENDRHPGGRILLRITRDD